MTGGAAAGHCNLWNRTEAGGAEGWAGLGWAGLGWAGLAGLGWTVLTVIKAEPQPAAAAADSWEKYLEKLTEIVHHGSSTLARLILFRGRWTKHIADNLPEYSDNETKTPALATPPPAFLLHTRHQATLLLQPPQQPNYYFLLQSR